MVTTTADILVGLFPYNSVMSGIKGPLEYLQVYWPSLFPNIL